MKLKVKDLVELYTALSQDDVYSVYVNENGTLLDYSYKQANTFVLEIEKIHKRVGLDAKSEENSKNMFTITSSGRKTYVYGIKPDNIIKEFLKLIAPLEGEGVEINELM